MSETQTINISTSTIFRTIFILLGLAFLFIVRDIVLMVFVAVLIATAVKEPVGWLDRHGIPRLLAVIFIYLTLALLLGTMVTLLAPSLASQIKQLAVTFPEFMDKVGLGIKNWQGKYQLDGTLRDALTGMGNRLTQITPNILTTIVDLFGGLFSAMVVLVISFYLAVQDRGVKKFLIGLAPHEHQHYVSDLVDRIQRKIGGWVRGELLLMLIIGLLTYVGLTLLGVNYALTLALIAAFLEIIPYIGPIIATVPAAILAFIQSPLLALLTVLLYIVVQQLENYVIVPQIMKRTVGLNPIIIIIVMLIGAKLAGVLGIILAVPVTASAVEFIRDVQKH